MQREMYLSAVAELRAAGAGSEKSISGYAALYNSRSEKIGGSFYEVIKPGAFKRVLATNPDVRMLVNHQPDTILGRTKSGTLTLAEDSRGLKFRCMLPDTQTARDTYESIRRGDMSQCSFGFGEPVDSWDEGTDENGDRCTIRSISSIGVLADVSCVTYPAYEATSVMARNGALPNIFVPIPPSRAAHIARVDRMVEVFKTF
ncbi:MAG TPA: HK97 family phage prohead protease [Candidatus Solibacter sp.]|nr:HK97 family phage prohead protease [Candidatus Solibacter sp.]